MNCDHKRIKKNYPFGKKSKPTMFCKQCDEVITPHDLMLKRGERVGRRIPVRKRPSTVRRIRR